MSQNKKLSGYEVRGQVIPVLPFKYLSDMDFIIFTRTDIKWPLARYLLDVDFWDILCINLKYFLYKQFQAHKLVDKIIPTRVIGQFNFILK